MGRGDSEKILQAYLEDILWHSEDVADNKGSHQSKMQLLNQYYKADDKHRTKRVHLRALYENILANIDVCRNLKQELEKAKTKSEDLEQALKSCEESKEYYKAKCKTILGVKYTLNFEAKGLPEVILDVQNRQIDELSKKCQLTREDVATLRKTTENIKIESRRMRRKFTSIRQKYAIALRRSGTSKKLKRYSNTLALNENPDEDWAEQNTQTDDEEPTKLEEENRELKVAYRNLREEHEELALEKEKLENQFKGLNEKLGNEAKERENLQREIEDCEEELTIWEKRCKDLSHTCNKLKEECEDLLQNPNDKKITNGIDTEKQEKTEGQKQPAIVHQVSALYISFGNCEDRLVPTSKLKKEMIKMHGKDLQELVAENKKLSKTQRNDDDSKHQQQEFKGNLNRVKGEIKSLEEDNDEERLRKINEVKNKFEEDMAKVLRQTLETLEKILEDTDRSDLLSRKYQELMSIMREENNRLESFSDEGHEEMNHETQTDGNSERENNFHEEVKDQTKEDSSVNLPQFDEIKTEIELMEETLEKFDGTETDEVRGNMKRQFLESIAKINAIKVEGDESVRTKKIETIKQVSKCIQELEKGGNH